MGKAKAIKSGSQKNTTTQSITEGLGFSEPREVERGNGAGEGVLGI